MKEFIGKRVIATTDNWFYAGDGCQYKAIWGTLELISKIDENTLGFTPNRPNVNWIYKIGDVFIQGCQIKYMILREDLPVTTGMRGWDTKEGNVFEYTTPNLIYITK